MTTITDSTVRLVPIFFAWSELKGLKLVDPACIHQLLQDEKLIPPSWWGHAEGGKKGSEFDIVFGNRDSEGNQTFKCLGYSCGDWYPSLTEVKSSYFRNLYFAVWR